MTKTTAPPWLSGHCNPANPPEIHEQCNEHPRADGTPCACTCHLPAPFEAGPGAVWVLSEPTTPVPDLDFPWPDCSVCEDDLGDMNYDGDRWWCEHCGAVWPKNGIGGHQ